MSILGKKRERVQIEPVFLPFSQLVLTRYFRARDRPTIEALNPEERTKFDLKELLRACFINLFSGLVILYGHLHFSWDYDI